MKKKRKTPVLSRLHKPETMSLEEWQIELRKQFGREQPFRLKNIGEHPVFSEFQVANPQSRNTYRVQVRGTGVGENSCSCPDFATNTLGTCKHIEFVVGRLLRNRSARSHFNEGYQPSSSEVYLQFGARRKVRFRLGRECSDEMARLAAKHFDDEGALKAASIPVFEQFLEKAAQIDPDVRCAEEVLSFLAELNDAEVRKQRVAEAFPKGIRSAAFKDLLKVSLYDYQREGALFAAKAGRCLIGDEMGLGKTIQALAAAEIMANLFGVERVLIVCPTSLKYQWQREIEKFCSRSVQVIGGLRDRRQRDFTTTDTFFKVMNYDTVHTDIDLIADWGPDLVVLDEAQRIKNWATRVARSVKKIASTYAIVLTGTPLENRLEELISIVQFVDRYRLGPTFRLLHDHQIRDDVGKVTGYQKLDQIGQTLEPVLLRRQKDQVLNQLPERIDTNIFVPMASLQIKHHTEYRELVAKIVHKWRKYKFLSEADKRRLMIFLQKMRMVCDSSYLVDSETNEGLKATEATTLLSELLERPGTKAVIFSQWLKMHELLQKPLKERGWGHVMFHGGVPSTKRKDLVDQFRDDPNCRAFLSTDAGGVGLNLQFASVVFNMDLPWNPAVLEQRIGRVHRLGQKQPVRVVNFVSKGTIEEGMLSVLRFKKSLFSGVLDGGASEVLLGGSKLTKFMETVEAATASIPTAPTCDEAKEAISELTGEMSKEDPPKRSAGETKEAANNPWEALIQTGMALLQQFTAPSRGGDTKTPVRSLVEKDAKTGEAVLRLPMPKPELLEQALSAVGKLLESFRN